MEDGPYSILLISESSHECAQLCEAVSEKGWSIETLHDWSAADNQLNGSDFDTLVVDLVREDGAGLDILKEIQANASPDTPILAVASMADKVSLMQALDMGVTDFLWRGASALDVQARLSTAFKLGAMRKQLNGAERVDKLTGTHKKDYIIELLEREFERSRRYKRPISCLLLDIDGFDEFKEKYDAKSIQALLRICSDALTDTLRNVDEVSRFRESIFLVLMPETSAGQSVIGLGRVRETMDSRQVDVQQALGNQNGLDALEQLTITAGIATYPDDGLNSHADLIMAAETALYEAKRKGRGETVRADFQ